MRPFPISSLAAFFIAFFHDPTRLPVLPDTLVGLTSASAIAYVAKKAASPAAVKVTAVSPQKGQAGTPVKIFGSGFRGGVTGNAAGPDVTIGGLTADLQGNATDTVVTVTVPLALAAGTVDVQVVTPDGRTATLPAAYEVT